MGQTPEVREGDREVGFTPQERTFLRTAASRQKRTMDTSIVFTKRDY
jgi:hypothetical protein